MNFLMIIKRVICLYVDNVNDKKIKISLLKMLNNFLFAKMLIYNYFYFELNIDKFDDIFLKMRIMLRKFKIFSLSRIIRVFWRFFLEIIKKKKIIEI